jgi:TorA maturation chaperone TorD
VAITQANAVAEANVELARSGVYALLSQLLAYPTAASVQDLLQEDLPFARAVAAPLPTAVRDRLEALAIDLQGATAGVLESAYRSIFSHVHSADCPPYETDHTAREIFRQSQQLADLAGFYRAFGVGQQAERPDHVAVELEFLHVLTYKLAWATIHAEDEHRATCWDAYRAFLRDHILRWIPSFATRLVVLGRGGPYAVVGALLAAVVSDEAARLGLDMPTDVDAGPQPSDAASMQDRGACEEDG